MRLLGDGSEARAEGTSAVMADTPPSGGVKERGRYQAPVSEEDDSGSDSEGGAETDDEESSTSDYPPHQLFGQPAVVATTCTATNRDTISSGADAPDSASTTLTSTTNSYLYGENASDRVRHLVKRSVSKKKKQLQRQTRPRKETNAPTPAGRRSKKMNRNVLKHSMDVSIY
jgi:hypothetical protein